MEVTHSLNTDSMINALRRFINLGGYPREIQSDCGSNFTKADKELKDTVDEWNQQRISGFCTQRYRGIKWIFNPPRVSHMGGPPMGENDTVCTQHPEGSFEGAGGLR